MLDAIVRRLKQQNAAAVAPTLTGSVLVSREVTE